MRINLTDYYVTKRKMFDILLSEEPPMQLLDTSLGTLWSCIELLPREVSVYLGCCLLLF